MSKFPKIALVALTLSFLMSCTTYKKTNLKIDETSNKIVAATHHRDKTQASVITKTGYYIDPRGIPLDENPAWLNQHVTLKAKNVPLNLLLSRLVRYQGVSINFKQNADPQRLASLNYKGPLKGALKTLSAATDTVYNAKDHELTWSAFETKTFDISSMPGNFTYLVDQHSEKNAIPHNNTSALTQPNDNEQGKPSAWKDLRNTLNQLKSKHGRVIISESTSTVTVYDRPSHMAAIENYINEMNLRFNQEVAIKVQVLEINLKKDFNYGIDWNLLTSALGTKLRLLGNAAAAIHIVNNTLITNNSNSAPSRVGVGAHGIDAFINALSQQGKVRVVTEPEVVTMNNQIAAIRITQSIGYIESVSQTNSQFFSTSSINPGSITDGFTLYILPKIQRNHVLLQLSSTIASLEHLDKVSNMPNSSHSSSTHYQAIQVPTLAQKSFNQRSLVNNGSTLILAGYRRLRDTNSDASFFGVNPSSDQGAAVSQIETLVLITPTIVQSNQPHVNVNSQ